MPYPNFQPIIDVIISLGFTRIEEFKYYHVYTRDMGGIPYFLRVETETFCWDNSDETIIHHGFGPLKNDKYDYDSIKHLQRRGSYSTNDVPTADELKEIILHIVGYEKAGAKKALLEAHENLKKAHARFVMSETFKW